VRADPIPQIYSPYAQTPWGFLSAFVQTDGDAAAIAPAASRAVAALDPLRPIRDVATTAAIVGRSTDRHRAMTAMLLALASLATFLAAIGLYGVSSAATAARSRELAIRAALGAQPGTLRRLVLMGGLATTLAGVAIGTLASLAAAPGLGPLLFGVTPSHPPTLVATAVFLCLISTLASWLPARRALRLKPSEVLRAE
jgi:putative ABC transport system permease protein